MVYISCYSPSLISYSSRLSWNRQIPFIHVYSFPDPLCFIPSLLPSLSSLPSC